MNKLWVMSALVAASLALGACKGNGAVEGALSEMLKKGENVSDTTLKTLGATMDAYCRNVAIPARLLLREKVNEFAEVSRIKIECNPGGDEDQDDAES